MKIYSVIGVVFFFSQAGLAQEAAPIKKGIDYTNCNLHLNGYGNPTYVIDKDGDLSFDPKNKQIVSWDAEKGDLVYREFWGMQDGNTKGPKTKVHIQKVNGVPAWLETTYDIEAQKRNTVAGRANTPVFASQKVTFGIREDKCDVRETSYKLSNAKEVVSYDIFLCSELLNEVKKGTMKKLDECKRTFATLHGILQKYEEKFKTQGRELQMGVFGTPVPAGSMANPLIDNDWKAIMSVGSCNMTRAVYGYNNVQDTTVPSGSAYAPPFGFGQPTSNGTGSSNTDSAQ